MGPVKDQASCGSCWAFSTIGVVEAFYKKKYNQELLLSEQNLIDCNKDNKGCKGGWFNDSLEYKVGLLDINWQNV